MVVENILENIFKVKNECFQHFKMKVFIFKNFFFSYEVETISWEGKVKLFRQWFWSYLDIKNEYSQCFKITFFTFLKIFEENVETDFWESDSKCSKLFKLRDDHSKRFSSYLDVRNECSKRLKMILFTFFASYWVTNLKLFSGKARKSIQSFLNPKVVIRSV